MNIRPLTPEDILTILLRKKWWILASVVLCLPLSYMAWKYVPKTYKSTVIMTIDSPRIAKEYVKGLSQGQEGRSSDDPMLAAMQQISMDLTSRSILMPVLETLKPYPETAGSSPDLLMKRLRTSIKVEKPKDGVGIAISYFHAGPHIAHAVTAMIASKLQEDHLRRREGIVETTTEFLSGELDRMKAGLEAKEQAISQFKKSHLGELPQQMEANLRTLDRLQSELTISGDSLNKLGERLTALERTIKEYSEFGMLGIAPLGRRGGDLRPVDPRATRLQGLRQKLNELSATFKENYPDIVYLKEEIRRLESAPPESIQAVEEDLPEGSADAAARNARGPVDPYVRELKKERDEVKSEIAFLKEKRTNVAQQIKELEGHVERAPTTEQNLAVLSRDYESMQKNYQSLLDKRTNARILAEYETHQFGEQYRIIEPANLPVESEPPTKLHFLLGGLALGCLIGFGSALGIEILKTGFRRPEEVESHLGLPVLASIPAFSSAMGGAGMLQSRALLAGPGMPGSTTEDAPPFLGLLENGASKLGKRESLNGPRGLSQNCNLITKWVPLSLIAEQYRVAATRLILMTAEKKNVVTLVTSSVMAEGKTTTAVNLAHILAHDLSKSILLIDCDFKRPMVHEYIGIPQAPGLTDILQKGELLENCIHQCDGLPLWVLPSGSPGLRSAGLSGIQYVKKILPELKTRYDHVLLDGPPVMPLADVNILSGMTDMTVFVVRAGRTSQDIAKNALKRLGSDNDAAGVILTQVEMEHAPYFTYAAAYTHENS